MLSEAWKRWGEVESLRCSRDGRVLCVLRSREEMKWDGGGWDVESKDEKVPKESFRPHRYLLCHRG